ncbi:hypothetical protein MNV49_006968 [Pseudohyphozyma bogoriensis]|nr:hypothetical protein MNV49_006968 [Pseudohyphozyma bogoriensis]
MSQETPVDPTPAAPAPTDAEPATAAAPAPAAGNEDASESTESSSSLLANGIKSLALKRYDQACDSLSRAVELLTEQNGELAPENCEAIMLYGKALLFNAISNSAVLGKAPPPDAADEKAAAGPSVTSGPVTAQNIQFHFGGDDPNDDDEDEEEGEGEGGEEEEDKEDDLESAFLMLDTARAILEKQTGEESMNKRAEVHRLLGDVASESENFDSASTEYLASLSLLQKLLPPSDRALSELHMLLALTLDFVPGRNSDAVKHAQLAKDVLLKRLEVLEGNEGEKEKAEKDDIKGLMGDVDEKIEDLKLTAAGISTEPTEKEKALENLLRPAFEAATKGAPVNDLSGLVKKKKKVAPAPEVEVKAEEKVEDGKRKAEEVEGKEEKSEKKVKFGEDVKQDDA